MNNFDLVRYMWFRKSHPKIHKISSTPPLTFENNGRPLKNYKIYGNTVNGESVGELVTEGEHAGEYCIPVMVVNGTDTKTTNIYLPEQIKKVEDEFEYIDYKKQKLYRVRVNLSEVNEFSNSITDTSNTLNIWVQQGKNDSFAYPPQQNIFVITEPTAITTSITITNYNDSIRIKHNGSKSDIVIDIVRGLSPGAYSVSFNVLNYDHTTVGGLVINNIMVNKGSTALPYEPYIKNTDLDVTLPALPTLSGTNTLSVGTEVQPSKVYIKGEFKKITTTYVQSIEPDNTNNKIIFVVRAYRSKNDRIVRTGLVATNDPAIGVNINVNSTVITSGCKVFVKEAAGVTPTTDNIKYTWTKTKVTDGEIWYVRSYVEYINSDNEQLIIYSDAAKASLDGII